MPAFGPGPRRCDTWVSFAPPANLTQSSGGVGSIVNAARYCCPRPDPASGCRHATKSARGTIGGEARLSQSRNGWAEARPAAPPKAKRKSAKPRTTAPAAAINPRPIKRWHTRTKVSLRIRRPASNRRTRNARNLSIKPTLITRLQEKRPVPTLQMMALRNYPPTGDSSQVSHRSMKSRSVNSGARRIFVLVLDAVEDAFQTIADFADQRKNSSARQSRPSARSPPLVGTERAETYVDEFHA